MKRDMDLIRRILLKAESQDEPQWWRIPFTVEGYDDGLVAKHVVLLIEAGLLLGRPLSTDQSGLQAAVVDRLTWDGHEFLEATRDEQLYQKAKGITIAKGGGLVFDVLKEVLISLTKARIFDPTGA
jgi:Hypothetical protein (DUF2513)